MKSIYFFVILAFTQPFSANAESNFQLFTQGEKKNFIYEQDPKALVTSVDLVIRTGGISDPKGKEGLAMISFASILRGTQMKVRKDFDAEMEMLGASLGVDTASNRTIYSLDSIQGNFEQSVQLLAEAVLKPRLDDAEIESLKVEVLAALQQEKANNRTLVKRAFRKAVFANTGLEVPASGTISSIKKITKQDIQAFLLEHIRRENIVFAVNSSLPQEKIRSIIEKQFQAIPSGGKTPSIEIKNTKPKGKRLFLVARPGSATTEIAIGHFGILAQKKDREALEMGLFLLGGDMSSRLFQELRAKNGWTYGVFASFQFLEIPRRHGGAFAIYSFPHAEHTDKTLKRTLEIYRTYVKQGVTAKELSFAKNTMKNSYPFQFASSRAKLTGRLYEFLDGAPLLSVNEYRKQVETFTTESMKKSIQSVHDSENLWIVMVGDPKALEAAKVAVKGVKEVVQISADELIP